MAFKMENAVTVPRFRIDTAGKIDRYPGNFIPADTTVRYEFIYIVSSVSGVLENWYGTSTSLINLLDKSINAKYMTVCFGSTPTKKYVSPFTAYKVAWRPRSFKVLPASITRLFSRRWDMYFVTVGMLNLDIAEIVLICMLPDLISIPSISLSMLFIESTMLQK